MCYGVLTRNQAITTEQAATVMAESPSSSPKSQPKKIIGAPKRKREPTIVHHNYHDHAQEAAPAGFHRNLLAATGNTFPLKLYEMLGAVEKDGIAHIVSWQPHGRCFLVHKPDQFSAKILPTYFRQSKISSFQRQLNLYGFLRISNGPDRSSYYHERFLQGMPWLLSGITRVRVKGTGFRARSNPDQEPDFWRMPWVGGSGSVRQQQPQDALAVQQQVQQQIKLQQLQQQQQKIQLPLLASSSAAAVAAAPIPGLSRPSGSCDLEPLPLSAETQPDLLLSCLERLQVAEPARSRGQQIAPELVPCDSLSSIALHDLPEEGSGLDTAALPLPDHMSIFGMAVDHELDQALDAMLEYDLAGDDDLARHLEELVVAEAV